MSGVCFVVSGASGGGIGNGVAALAFCFHFRLESTHQCTGIGRSEGVVSGSFGIS